MGIRDKRFIFYFLTIFIFIFYLGFNIMVFYLFYKGILKFSIIIILFSLSSFLLGIFLFKISLWGDENGIR